MPAFATQIDADRDLALDLTVYYCEAEDARLCLIHEWQLLAPPTADAAEARLNYQVQTESFE